MNRLLSGKSLVSNFGLLLLAAAFLAFTLLNNLMFSGARLDLTENSIYTLSDGSRSIVDKVDEPINLYFFFSDTASTELTAVRSYAKRVQELLEEYALYGGSKLQLTAINPEPFSEEEDQASEFGLQAVPVNTAGDNLYFGLAGTNSVGDVEVIAFFQPDKEEFLEYDISKLIHSLTTLDKPVLGLMSSLKVDGDINMQNFQQTPPWVVISQLQQLFDVRPVDTGAETIDADVTVLMLVHPKALSDATLLAIDQFVMRGGNLIAFMDPLAEMDAPQQPNPMAPQAPPERSSDLNKITGAWGVTLAKNKIVGDQQTALQVGGAGGSPVRHLGILGLEPDNFDADDVTMNALESVNVATAGYFDVDLPEGMEVVNLVTSTEFAMPLDAFQFQFLRDPADLQKGFKPTGERYPIAVRIGGPALSAFPEGIGSSEVSLLKKAEFINVILVADTDILSDRLWVQVQNFFGQQIASPWANNGDLVTNAVDNLFGSTDLISIRSRGRFSRPFDLVQDLRREAETQYLDKANELQAQLADTERNLSELQKQRQETNQLGLSVEQQAELARFEDEKLRIRKELRDVRHQLDQDIESLGVTLKFLNVALIPLLLTALLFVGGRLRQRSRMSDLAAEA